MALSIVAFFLVYLVSALCIRFILKMDRFKVHIVDKDAIINSEQDIRKKSSYLSQKANLMNNVETPRNSILDENDSNLRRASIEVNNTGNCSNNVVLNLD